LGQTVFDVHSFNLRRVNPPFSHFHSPFLKGECVFEKSFNTYKKEVNNHSKGWMAGKGELKKCDEANTRNILIIVFVIFGVVLIAAILVATCAYWRYKK
jgi:hypothetical protein